MTIKLIIYTAVLRLTISCHKISFSGRYPHLCRNKNCSFAARFRYLNLRKSMAKEMSTGILFSIRICSKKIRIVLLDPKSTCFGFSFVFCRLLMMQFTVDQMSLELQSRGRSVAELQVAGVKVALTKRAVDSSITLTVHSLLLVDALQNFGPDFELLVASHKHVGRLWFHRFWQAYLSRFN